MKTVLKYVAMAAIATTALSSCSNDDELITKGGEGTIYLSTRVNSDIKVRSRATVEELSNSAMIWISNSKGVVRRFDSSNTVPAEGVRLLADNYVAEAWTGDSVPASFEHRYFKGSQDFTIANNDRKSVEIVCKLANSVVTVSYDDQIDAVLHDYSVNVGHSQGSLDFVGRTDARGYFMMNSRDKNLTWTLNGTLANGDSYTRTGVIEACKPATQYNIVIKCSETSGEIGGAYFTIEVDESAVEVEDEITIIAPPEVRGLNTDGTLYSLPKTVQVASGSKAPVAMWITTSTTLESLIVGCPYFNSLLGLEPGVEDFDFMYKDMDPALKQRIAAAGIVFDYDYDNILDQTTVRLTFDDKFISVLAEGDYVITAEAVDGNGKKGSGTLTIRVGQGGTTPDPGPEPGPTDDVVSTGYPVQGNIWASKATITGTVNKAEEAVAPKLMYRKRGTTAWTEAATTQSGTALSATITGLESGTEYEYCAADGDFYAAVMSFTTEAHSQMPNSGFENWSKPGKILFLYGEGESMFWDSGNTGASTLNKNVTTNDSDIKHSGSYSAKLASQFVGFLSIGKFAAGNAFVGEYLGTDGMDGILGWGRPWSTRPAQLKGWVKYTPATIEYDADDYNQLKKGDMDKGIIYIALLDDSRMDSYNGKSYPQIVKTKEKEFFDKNGSNVIAYGEMVLDGATSGDGMVEFTINLNYTRTDVKPSYILCTASASIGGDYFVGGKSTMWLDDLELVYE